MSWEEVFALRSEKIEVLEQFLTDVNEQIRYQPMHAAVDEELRAHVEDKAQMYIEYGVGAEEAYKKAVRDMGDASALGIQMNDAHHLRIAKPLLALILFLMLVPGLGGNIFDWKGLKFDDLYFVWGSAVLTFIMLYGYPVLLKHTNVFLILFEAGCLGLCVLGLIARAAGYPAASGLLFTLFSPSVRFGVLQMAVPVAAVLLYRNRKHGWKCLIAAVAFEAILILLARYSHMSEYAYVPILTMLLTSFGIVLYMILKDYFTVNKKKGILAAFAGLAALLMLFCGIQWQDISENLQRFVNPDARASVSNAWDDSYNNVLIRELLGKAEVFGEIRLTEEELVRYGTSQWYYEDGEGSWNEGVGWDTLEKHVKYEMQFLDEPELEDILPQHYHNNYRIAYWILKTGWISGLLLLALILTTQAGLFITAYRIRNRLGCLVAISGSLALCIQNLFYLLGNFGCQFGAFGNLPFVSEGWVSITGTAIMAGLVLSAYRFDTVIKEQA